MNTPPQRKKMKTLMRIGAEGCEELTDPVDKHFIDAGKYILSTFPHVTAIAAGHPHDMACKFVESLTSENVNKELDERYTSTIPPFDCGILDVSNSTITPKDIFDWFYWWECTDRKKKQAQFDDILDDRYRHLVKDSHRFLLHVWPFCAPQNGKVRAPEICLWILVHEDGRPDFLTLMFSMTPTLEQSPRRGASTLHSLQNGFSLEIILPVLETFEMMSFNNITLDEREIDPSYQKRFTRRFGDRSGSYKYHVLWVHPAGYRRSSKEKSPGREFGTMPEHLVKRHWARYGPQFGRGLLFGKYAGKFMISAIVKGKKSNGVVCKDYGVAPPKPDVDEPAAGEIAA